MTKLMWQYVRALHTENTDAYAAVYTPDGQFGLLDDGIRRRRAKDTGARSCRGTGSRRTRARQRAVADQVARRCAETVNVKVLKSSDRKRSCGRPVYAAQILSVPTAC